MTDCFCSLASTNLLLSCYFRLVTSLRLTRCRERWQAEGGFGRAVSRRMARYARNTRRRAATFGPPSFPPIVESWASVFSVTSGGPPTSNYRIRVAIPMRTRPEKIQLSDTVRTALWVPLHAKPGKEAAVESILKRGLAVVQREPATTSWFAL